MELAATLSFVGPPQVVKGALLPGSQGFGVRRSPHDLLRVSVPEGDLLHREVFQQIPRGGCLITGFGPRPSCQLGDRFQFVKPSD